jgi:hypothetical protein
MTIAFRPAELDDAQFIVSTWSRGFKTSRSAGMIASEDWERVMHPQIQKVLARADVRTVVAFENTDPAFLYGWISADPAASPPIVFFCYVKESYRRAGYARGLFATVGIDPHLRFNYTCWTPIIHKLGLKIPNAKHDPNLARYPGPKPGASHGNDEAR